MGLGFLTGGAAFVGLAGKFGGYVHDGEVFIDRRLGNYDSPTFHKYSTFPPYVHTYTAEGENFRYGIKRRGLAVHKPGIQKWVPLSTRFNPAVRLESQTVQSQENRWLRVGGTITWRVLNEDSAIYTAITAVNNNRATQIIEQLHPLVVATTSGQLADTMAGKKVKEMANREERAAELRTRCSGPLYDLGVCLGAVILDSPHYTESDQEAHAITQAAKETAGAIYELAAAIRGSSQAGQTELNPEHKTESDWLQEASRAAIGGVLAQSAQFSRGATQVVQLPVVQNVPQHFDAAEGQY